VQEKCLHEPKYGNSQSENKFFSKQIYKKIIKEKKKYCEIRDLKLPKNINYIDLPMNKKFLQFQNFFRNFLEEEEKQSYHPYQNFKGKLSLIRPGIKYTPQRNAQKG